MSKKKKKKSVSSLLIGSRSVHMHFYVTKQFKEVLTKFWDYKNFPDTARLKRDPFDPSIKIPFKSERDFIETILRKEFLKSKIVFNIDFSLHNPDHPDFPDSFGLEDIIN